MMNVIFMGTPQFAVPSLRAIVKAGYTVPLVVTAPDRPRGRGLQLTPSEVKRAAMELGLNVQTPESLKDPVFLESIRQARPDVICVVAFRILPESLYTIPPKGSFNLHGSLLPRYRGAAPINRALMNGEQQTGLTTFFLQKTVDTGTIIRQIVIPITPDMTAGELHDVMMQAGAGLVVETLGLIESGRVVTQPQDEALASPAPKIFREDCLIDWSLPAEKLHNHVRGLSPYPTAFTTYRNRTIKLYKTRVSAGSGQMLQPGQPMVTDAKTLLIGTGHGLLQVLELQQEGRRRMPVEEFLRGFSVENGVFFGT